ncbi:MAG: DUF3127 domain-containing protein [Mangrovibacterium sp.]
MEIKGKISRILEPVSGVSKAGNEWRKREFVIEIAGEQFPRQICFTLFNDKLNLLDGMTPGTEVNVSFSVESREYNGRWYHNINAWKVEPVNKETPENFPPDFQPGDIPPEPEDSGNDLPF